MLSASWSPEHRELWERAAAHSFENDGVALDFIRRLARTLGWPIAETRALIEEYRRFCFLAVVTDIGPVTPSEEVDEVWHLHLAYTRDYWERWCGEALRRRLHHDPTAGGPNEQARYRDQYAATLALYERWFGPPPAAFWPGTAQRFAARPRFRMIDERRRWAPRLRWPLRTAGLALAAVVTPARSAGIVPDLDWAAYNPLDFDGESFLTLYVALMVVVWVVTWLARDMARTTDRRPDMRDLGEVELAYCVGGDHRAADTLYVALASRGAARLDRKGIVVEGPVAGLPPQLEAFRAALVGWSSHRSFLKAFADCAPHGTIKERLLARKILLDPARRARLAVVTWLPGALLLALGGAKVMVGLARDKPVGFLLFLMFVVAVAIIAVRSQERYLTRETRASLDALRASRNRALRAPRPEELAFAFAMLGAVALDGTPHAAYAKFVKPQDGGGASGCGSDGGGSGGGGCGGCSS